jgi:hypothetical protein
MSRARAAVIDWAIAVGVAATLLVAGLSGQHPATKEPRSCAVLATPPPDAGTNERTARAPEPTIDQREQQLSSRTTMYRVSRRIVFRSLHTGPAAAVGAAQNARQFHQTSSIHQARWMCPLRHGGTRSRRRNRSLSSLSVDRVGQVVVDPVVSRVDRLAPHLDCVAQSALLAQRHPASLAHAATRGRSTNVAIVVYVRLVPRLIPETTTRPGIRQGSGRRHGRRRGSGRAGRSVGVLAPRADGDVPARSRPDTIWPS